MKKLLLIGLITLVLVSGCVTVGTKSFDEVIQPCKIPPINLDQTKCYWNNSEINCYDYVKLKLIEQGCSIESSNELVKSLKGDSQ